MSRLILESNGLAGKYCFDFDEASWRVALLDAPDLQRLIRFSGIAIKASRIAKCIDKASVDAIKQGIGADGYLFAVKLAVFLVRPPAYFLDALPDTGDFRADAASGGRMLIEACLAGAPEAVTGRVRLKLPREFTEKWFAGEAGGVKKEDAWSVMKKVLLREIAPAWAHCMS